MVLLTLNGPPKQIPEQLANKQLGVQNDLQTPAPHLQLCKLVRFAASVLCVGELGEQKFSELRALERTSSSGTLPVSAIAKRVSATVTGGKNRTPGESP